MYGFIGHYLNLPHAKSLSGRLGKMLDALPPYTAKWLTKKLPPYKLMNIPVLKSSRGNSALGVAVMAPFYPEQVAVEGEQVIIELVARAINLAAREGALIVGLGGFTSVVGNEGEQVQQQVDIPVTSGNTYTAYLAIQGIYKACKVLEIDLHEASVAVIGATGDIGSICSKVLSQQVESLTLVARDKQRLGNFQEYLQREASARLSLTTRVRDAVKDADIVLSTASAITTLFEPQDFKPGSILCDVALPHVVGAHIRQARPDVLVFEGGMCRLPHPWVHDRRVERVFSDGRSIFGCLAETILLDLEGRYESFSIGRGNITQERLQEIGSIENKHGFGVADFCYSGRTYTQDELSYIQASRAATFKSAAS